MAGTRRCKVCGCEYSYCKTHRDTGIFRWQDVACSPEHGAIYFAEVAEARGESISSMDSALLSELEGDDDIFEEDFEDSEEEIAIEQ